MTGPVFVYGTLLFPEVLRALLWRVPPRTAAVAPGWRAAELRGRTYPGLVPAAGETAGLLVHGLTAAERELLDVFEEDPYQLRPIDLAGGGRALTYVWPDETAALPTDWDRATFAADHLTGFAARCAAWTGATAPGARPDPAAFPAAVRSPGGGTGPAPA